MGDHSGYTIIILNILWLLTFPCQLGAYPTEAEELRMIDRGFSLTSPGVHQLASWLVSQLRQAEYEMNMSNTAQNRPIAFPLPYRLPVITTGKRNSEITSSIMGIPRTMIDNGRAK